MHVALIVAGVLVVWLLLAAALAFLLAAVIHRSDAAAERPVIPGRQRDDPTVDDVM